MVEPILSWYGDFELNEEKKSPAQSSSRSENNTPFLATTLHLSQVSHASKKGVYNASFRAVSPTLSYFDSDFDHKFNTLCRQYQSLRASKFLCAVIEQDRC